MSNGGYHFSTKLKSRYIGYYKDDHIGHSDVISAVIHWEFLLEGGVKGIDVAHPIIHEVIIEFEDETELIIKRNFQISQPIDYLDGWVIRDMSVCEDYVDIQF